VENDSPEKQGEEQPGREVAVEARENADTFASADLNRDDLIGEIGRQLSWADIFCLLRHEPHV